MNIVLKLFVKPSNLQEVQNREGTSSMNPPIIKLVYNQKNGDESKDFLRNDGCFF